MRIDGFGHGLFVLALASVAILTLYYVDFVPMGQAIPAWLTWRHGWLYGSAVLMLVLAIGLCFQLTALVSALLISIYQLIWAVICLLPVFPMPRSVGAWYGFCEALAPLIAAVILYGQLRWQRRASRMPNLSDFAVRVAQAVFGLTCIFYGWSHFAYANYTGSMVPAYFPVRVGLAYFTGACHIAAGIALVIGILPRLAANLEALMMTLFGLLVWVPSFYAIPTPQWATPPQDQWSELVVNLVLAAAAWVVAASLKYRPWFQAR